jgi:hypothetical protein
MNLNIFAGQIFKSPFYRDKPAIKKNKPTVTINFVFFLERNWAK